MHCARFFSKQSEYKLRKENLFKRAFFTQGMYKNWINNAEKFLKFN